ncbi:MAG TPA: hypothetical protein V6D07_18675 [Trichocoleus sp.]
MLNTVAYLVQQMFDYGAKQLVYAEESKGVTNFCTVIAMGEDADAIIQFLKQRDAEKDLLEDSSDTPTISDELPNPVIIQFCCEKDCGQRWHAEITFSPEVCPRCNSRDIGWTAEDLCEDWEGELKLLRQSYRMEQTEEGMTWVLIDRPNA